MNLIADGDITRLTLNRPDELGRITTLRRDIDRLLQQVDGLIEKQVEPGLSQTLTNIYTCKIIEPGKRIDAMRQQLRDLEQTAESPRQINIMQHAYTELCTIGLERFWEQDSRSINQFLHRLMGNKRFVVAEKALIGLTAN